MPPRPFQQSGIDALEKMVEGNGERVAPKILQSVLRELKIRKNSKRNGSLIGKIESLLERENGKPLPTKRKVKSNDKAQAISVPKAPPTVLPDPPQENGELPAHLAEFIVALKEEIQAAKRNAASSAYLLTDGKLIAPIGNGYHYRFQSQRQLKVPPETPGEFRPGNGDNAIKVIVVESKGPEVIVEVPGRLSTSHLQGKLITDLSMLLEKLIERIETKGVLPQPSADRILGLRAHSGETASFEPLNSRLNEEQRKAVSSVLGMDTVFLWGPPGTGKTQTIGEIGAQLFLRGQTLLLVSHTNTAVDEALLRIAQSVDGRFSEGDILRLGEPVKSELANRHDLILKKVAEKRSVELEAQKRKAESERIAAISEIELVHRRVELLQWLADADRDLHGFRSDLEAVKVAEERLSLIRQTTKGVAIDSDRFRKDAEMAQLAIDDDEHLQSLTREIQALRDGLSQAEGRRETVEIQFADTQAALHVAESIEPSRVQLASLPAEAAVIAGLDQAALRLEGAKNEEGVAITNFSAAQELLERTSSVGAIKRIWQKLPKPEEQEVVVRVSRGLMESARVSLQSANRLRNEFQSTLDRVRRLRSELSAHAGVPSLTDAKAAYRAVSVSLRERVKEIDLITSKLSAIAQEKETAAAKVKSFVDRFESSPTEALARASRHLDDLEQITLQERDLNALVTTESRKLKETIGSLLVALREWNLVDHSVSECGEIGGQLDLVASAVGKARMEVGLDDLASLETTRNRLSAHVASLMAEIRSIEEALKKVEETLLANVRVLATTLTRAFMRGGIQDRTFDTVLVDEASMAPIPALWASAVLADRCVVAVGDFKQLPPIVQSDHALALRWLGRDVFMASGVQGAHEREEGPRHFVALCEQHRMHPQISAIVNDLVYRNKLRDGDSVSADGADEQIKTWYSADINAAPRVSVIDTSGAGAWNTTAVKSRFNVLSAMVGIELAKSWLAEDRPPLEEDGKKRVLMIAPYRPQAKILDMLVRAEGLDGEIMANTVHSFQGSEADLVIVDLVVANPHYGANLLTSAIDEDVMRLLNVAFTRSRRRLVILADIDWFTKKGKGAFIGKTLLPWLIKRYRPYALVQVMESRTKREQVLSGNESLSLFLDAVQSASSRVVIFSPVLSMDSVSAALPVAKDLQTRGVRFFVVTSLVGEGGDPSQSHTSAENLLRDAGITVVYKSKSLEKLVLIDRAEVWSGSFPLLGQVPSKGFYTRTVDSKFTTELSEMLCIDQIVDAYAPAHLCPICSAEMVVADSSEGAPFFWKCSKAKCFTRNFDVPAPVDGVLLLKCGGSPEFSYWGKDPYWFCGCGQNPPHRTKIQKNHLMLPKMHALVPRRSIAKLRRHLGLDGDGTSADNDRPKT